MTLKIAIALAVSLLASSPAMSADEPGATPRIAQWLATLTLKRAELLNTRSWTSADKQTGEAHFAYWKDRIAAGEAVLIGRTIEENDQGQLAPDTVGIVIFEAPSADDAETMLQADPGIRAGLWQYKLQPYRVALTRR